MKKYRVKYKKKQYKAYYPSSLIQQNFGESVDKGFIMWEINDKNDYDSKFIKIDNDNVFITVDDNSIDILDKYKDKKINLRIRTNKSNYNDRNDLIEKIKDKKLDFEIKSFIKEKDEISNIPLLGSDSSNIKLYINNYCDKLNYTEKEKNSIIDSYDKIVKENNIKSLDANNNFIKLVSVEFENVLIYKDKQKINFDDIDGLVGIFGNNKSGKSSLIDVILFSIFGYISKPIYKLSSIIHEGQSNCYTKVLLQIGDRNFTIERTIKKSKGEKTSATVNFYEIIDGKQHSLNGENKNNTELEIEKYFNDLENAVFTNFFIQNNFDNIIDLKESKFKKMLYKFFDLEKFENIYSIANDEYKILSKAILNFDKEKIKDEVRQQETLQLEISVSISDTKKEIEKLENEKLLFDKKIDDNLRKLYNMDINYDIDDLKQSKKEYTDDFLRKKEQLLLLENNINDNNKSIDKLITEKDKKFLDIDGILLLLEEQLNETNNKIDFNNNEISKISGIIDSNEKLNKFLSENRCENKDCFFMKKIDSYVNKKEQFVNNKKNLSEQLFELKNKLKDLSTKINDAKTLKINYTNSIDKLQQKNEKIINDYNLLNVSIEKHELLLKAIDEKISKYYEIEDKIKQNIEINKIIDDLNYKKNDVTKDINKFNDILMEKNVFLNSIKNTIESKNKSIINFEEKHEQKQILEKFIKIFHYDGIQFSLLLNYLDTINRTIDNMISDYFNFKISLECVDDDKKYISLFLIEDDTKMEIELCSGMQKFISSIALKISLLKISKINRFSSIFIDEGFGSLDSISRKNLSMFLDNVKNHYNNIFLVTHVDFIKEIVDKYIMINRNGKSSYIDIYKS